MSLEIIKEISVDFYYSKYIQINAKQDDKSSRFILVTCYNQGTLFPIDNTYNYAFIRYRKPDALNVFNSCNITKDGKILIELTEQMLAFDSKCYADLVIVHNEPIPVDSIEINNGELITNENTSILSSMLFCINVIETALDSSEIESCDEYNALNDLLIKATTEYDYVMKACKISEENSKTSEINAKESEEKSKVSEEKALTSELNAKTSETNAKESEEKALTSESNAKTSETNAKKSETNARYSEIKAKTSETNAKESETNAKTSETNAKESEANAKTSEINAKESEEKSKVSESNAKISETNAKESETKAKTSEENASASEQVAVTKAKEASESASTSTNNAVLSTEQATKSENNALLSQSYAVGGTGTRANENADNSKYYYSQMKAISETLGGVFLPQGTIEFSELQTVTKAAGYVYHIENAFITDDTFKCGAGIAYPEGTNVYCTADGYWDCFATKDLIVTDDDNGNVTIEDTYNAIVISGDEYSALNNTITDLQERIKALEEQTVLEVVE